jgi:large subunit ribosomal protein L18e
MNELLQKLIVDLKMLDKPVWRRVATDLDRSNRGRRAVNIERIERYAKAGLTVVVPGKVLSSGAMTKKVNVVAFQFSETAAKKIAKAGGSVSTFAEYIKKNPEGKQVQILG